MSVFNNICMLKDYLLMLFGNLLFFFLLLLGVIVILPGVLEAGDEVVEDTKELVALGDSWILTEQATHSVELKIMNMSRQIYVGKYS